MKKTVTGFLTSESNSHFVTLITNEKKRQNDVTVTLTFDDGKKTIKKVWEWMIKDPDCWRLANKLCDEEEAAQLWGKSPRRKLRFFEVEVDE